jgi:ABC-type nitrate/sulfonate/bicarbonate transport system substrate-binding protein
LFIFGDACIARSWPYAALDIGVDEGIFAKYNLDVEVTVLSGGARFQQALASNSIDVGVSGTAAMPQTIKGSPVIAIAATVGAPDPEARPCRGRGVFDDSSTT